MKKSRILLAAILSMLMLNACGNDDDGGENDMVGEWKAMDISADSVAVKDSSNAHFVKVPADGASFTLSVDNYDGWYVSSLSVQPAAGAAYQLVYRINHGTWQPDTAWYDIDVLQNKAKCLIHKNQTSETRTLKLSMASGDIFADIYVVQSPR